MHVYKNQNQANEYTPSHTYAYKIFQFHIFIPLSSLYLENKMDLNSLAPQIPKRINDKAPINGDTNTNGSIIVFPWKGFSSDPFYTQESFEGTLKQVTSKKNLKISALNKVF